MGRKPESTEMATSQTRAFEVQVKTIDDFFIILSAREQARISLLTKAQEIIKCWFSTESAKELIIKRAVWVAPMQRRNLSAHGLPEKVHRFVLVSFSFKDTIVSYLHNIPKQLEVGHLPDSQEVSTDHQCLFTETKAQFELAIATLGLAVPVLTGTLSIHNDNNNG